MLQSRFCMCKQIEQLIWQQSEMTRHSICEYIYFHILHFIINIQLEGTERNIYSWTMKLHMYKVGKFIHITL